MAKWWHQPSKVPGKCARHHFLKKQTFSKRHEWQCPFCKEPRTNVLPLQTKSTWEIIVTQETVLEGMSRAFLQKRCHHSSCHDVDYHTCIRFKQKDWKPWNPQCFNKSVLSTILSFAIHNEIGSLIRPLDSVAGFLFDFVWDKKQNECAHTWGALLLDTLFWTKIPM